MRYLPAAHERISFEHQAGLPEMELRFSGCRTCCDGHIYDILEFSEKAIDRWSVPHLAVPKAIELLERSVPAGELPLGAASHEDHFRAHYMAPHTPQISHNGQLLIGFGDPYNGFCIQVIDAETQLAHIFPEGFAGNLMLRAGGRGLESLYRFEAVDRAHQVTCSPDGRYVVFAPFKWDLNVPYPSARLQEAPEGYRRSHEAGIKPQKLVTVDLESRRHWETDIPTPVVAHPHFDPRDPEAFSLSAHNICPTAAQELRAAW